MHALTAYERRHDLGVNELERLLAALRDEVERYRVGIKGYNPEKIWRFGQPYLGKLEARVAEVDRLLSTKR